MATGMYEIVREEEYEAWRRIAYRSAGQAMPSCPSCGAHDWRAEHTGNRRSRSATVTTWCGRCHRSGGFGRIACARNLPEDVPIREAGEPSAVPADVRYVVTAFMAEGLGKPIAFEPRRPRTFAGILVESIRDEAIESCDENLGPHVVNEGWRAAGVTGEIAELLIPFCVDVTILCFLAGLDAGHVPLRFKAGDGTAQPAGSLAAWYRGPEARTTSAQRTVDQPLPEDAALAAEDGAPPACSAETPRDLLGEALARCVGDRAIRTCDALLAQGAWSARGVTEAIGREVVPACVYSVLFSFCMTMEDWTVVMRDGRTLDLESRSLITRSSRDILWRRFSRERAPSGILHNV